MYIVAKFHRCQCEADDMKRNDIKADDIGIKGSARQTIYTLLFSSGHVTSQTTCCHSLPQQIINSQSVCYSVLYYQQTRPYHHHQKGHKKKQEYKEITFLLMEGGRKIIVCLWMTAKKIKSSWLM